MDHPQPNIFTPDRRPDLPGPRLPMPVETPVPSTQTDLDVLKQEIKGLSATMLALSSQMSNSTQSKPPSNSTVQKDSSPSANLQQSSQTVPQDSTSQPVQMSTRLVEATQAVTIVPHDAEEIEESSESEEESSDENMSDDDSAEDSDEISTTPLVVDGYLDWPSLVSLIQDKFPDRIPPEEDSQPVARIGNLGG